MEFVIYLQPIINSTWNLKFICNQLSISHETSSLFAINYQFPKKFLMYFESFSNNFEFVIYYELFFNFTWNLKFL